MGKKKKSQTFPSAQEDARSAELCAESPQTLSSAYRMAYSDHDFLLRDELRPVRLQLELLKPEIIMNEHRIEGTVVVFGGARIPDPETASQQVADAEAALRKDPDDPQLQESLKKEHFLAERSKYYDEARSMARLISQGSKAAEKFNLVVVTGGDPGIMEAANRGVHDAGMESIGLNIVLPHEQKPNEYIMPELCFQFHYFAIRKMHFLIRAKALVVFPGGYGMLDELFETLTLIQTKKIKPFPVLIFGKAFWERIINFEALAEEGVISPEDIDLFRYVETAKEAWDIISGDYRIS